MCHLGRCTWQEHLETKNKSHQFHGQDNTQWCSLTHDLPATPKSLSPPNNSQASPISLPLILNPHACHISPAGSQAEIIVTCSGHWWHRVGKGSFLMKERWGHSDLLQAGTNPQDQNPSLQLIMPHSSAPGKWLAFVVVNTLGLVGVKRMKYRITNRGVS